jgi:hypothetical protein
MAAMTAQEIFDKVTTHLLTQMKQSREAGIGCKYRGPDGLMCALGCLIEDSEYSPDMEMTLSAMMEKGLCTLSLMSRLGITQGDTVSDTDKNLYLLHQLQYIHDANQPEAWKEQLKKLAVTLKLQFNPPAEQK